ncbi:MAG: deoxyribose-phosphate aldolase [Bacteroidales bacterium]|nr:deoxyribose-phosphate aldolase [Bacteroidales bacterium]MDD4210007.1 deoxyribose-phosphate aldolase [Bacteroidales bacterium]
MNINNINSYIENIKTNTLTDINEKSALELALQCLDLTSLNATDTEKDIIDLCEKAKVLHPLPATVCVYSPFCKLAKKELKNTSVKIACVAGGFPSGQLPIILKIQEVNYAISEGADEIDMVISIGKFLEGKYTDVYDEIAAIKSACKDIILKVILETGELVSLENTHKASEIAINAGADFIKTSTGKTTINATPESFTTMLLAIKNHYKNTGKKVGIKPAGGIKEVKDVLLYISILRQTLGENWMNKKFFRIGASSVADRIIERLHIL